MQSSIRYYDKLKSYRCVKNSSIRTHDIKPCCTGFLINLVLQCIRELAILGISQSKFAASRSFPIIHDILAGVFIFGKYNAFVGKIIRRTINISDYDRQDLSSFTLSNFTDIITNITYCFVRC